MYIDPTRVTDNPYNGQVQLLGHNRNIKRALKLYFIKKDQNADGFLFVCTKPGVFTQVFFDTVCRQLGFTNSNGNETQSIRYSYYCYLVYSIIIINILLDDFMQS